MSEQHPTEHHPTDYHRDPAAANSADGSGPIRDDAPMEGRPLDGPGDGPAKGNSDGSAGDNGEHKPGSLTELVDQPAKVMRIGTMIRQLLEEVRNAPLDDAARNRLAGIHDRSLKELEDGLAPELVDELHRTNLPFTDDETPSDAELRIAQAQLVGWLEGLFHGIQTAMAAQQSRNQQLAAQMQMRQLPPGTLIAPGVVIGENGEPRRASGAETDPRRRNEGPATGPGQYL